MTNRSLDDKLDEMLLDCELYGRSIEARLLSALKLCREQRNGWIEGCALDLQHVEELEANDDHKLLAVLEGADGER